MKVEKYDHLVRPAPLGERERGWSCSVDKVDLFLSALKTLQSQLQRHRQTDRSAQRALWCSGSVTGGSVVVVVGLSRGCWLWVCTFVSHGTAWLTRTYTLTHTFVCTRTQILHTHTHHARALRHTLTDFGEAVDCGCLCDKQWSLRLVVYDWRLFF